MPHVVCHKEQEVQCYGMYCPEAVGLDLERNALWHHDINIDNNRLSKWAVEWNNGEKQCILHGNGGSEYFTSDDMMMYTELDREEPDWQNRTTLKSRFERILQNTSSQEACFQNAKKYLDRVTLPTHKNLSLSLIHI